MEQKISKLNEYLQFVNIEWNVISNLPYNIDCAKIIRLWCLFYISLPNIPAGEKKQYEEYYDKSGHDGCKRTKIYNSREYSIFAKYFRELTEMKGNRCFEIFAADFIKISIIFIGGEIFLSRKSLNEDNLRLHLANSDLRDKKWIICRFVDLICETECIASIKSTK